VVRPLLLAATVACSVVACGGGHKPAAAPASNAGAVPLAGLEAATFGDPLEEIEAAFPGAELQSDHLWLEDVEVEGIPAVVMLGFDHGALRTVTVAFDLSCDLFGQLAEVLDAKLGARTNSEPGIAAWNRAGWDLALYCATGDAGEFPRLDARPAAVF
jgi:hypothetical protein